MTDQPNIDNLLAEREALIQLKWKQRSLPQFRALRLIELEIALASHDYPRIHQQAKEVLLGNLQQEMLCG